MNHQASLKRKKLSKFFFFITLYCVELCRIIPLFSIAFQPGFNIQSFLLLILDKNTQTILLNTVKRNV